MIDGGMIGVRPEGGGGGDNTQNTVATGEAGDTSNRSTIAADTRSGEIPF